MSLLLLSCSTLLFQFLVFINVCNAAFAYSLEFNIDNNYYYICIFHNFVNATLAQTYVTIILAKMLFNFTNLAF